MKTSLERMNMAYSIAKKWVEESGQHLKEIDLQDKGQAAILRFVVVRDFPSLEPWEVESVMVGVKTIVELAVAENHLKKAEPQQQERKHHVFD